jgi:hypothetical protein
VSLEAETKPSRKKVGGEKVWRRLGKTSQVCGGGCSKESRVLELGVPSLIDFGRREQAECNQPRFVEKSREEGRKTKTKTCLCDECPKERSVSGAGGVLLLYSNRASECNQPFASFASCQLFKAENN